MKLNLYEIFDKFRAAKTEDEKRRILVQNETPDLVAFLQCAFDPRVKFVKLDFPTPVNRKPTKGEYRPSDLPPGFGSNMGNAIKKTYLFVEGHPRRPPALSQEKTNELLVSVLEGLEAREAELYIAMLKKAVKVPGLTKPLIEKTFLHIFEVPVKVV